MALLRIELISGVRRGNLASNTEADDDAGEEELWLRDGDIRAVGSSSSSVIIGCAAPMREVPGSGKGNTSCKAFKYVWENDVGRGRPVGEWRDSTHTPHGHFATTH